MKYRCVHCCELYEEEDLVNGRCPECDSEVYGVKEEDLRNSRAEKALAEIERYMAYIHGNEYYGANLVYKSMQDRDYFNGMLEAYGMKAEWGVPEETKLIEAMIDQRVYFINEYLKEGNYGKLIDEAEELKGLKTAYDIYSAVDKGE